MSRATQDTAIKHKTYLYGTFTLCGWKFQNHSNSFYAQIAQSYNPNNAETLLVWAVPRSLATTSGITIVFFSSGYLDVSVPLVCSSIRGNTPSTYWVAPFGNPGIKGYLHLLQAYRSLSRPSSPPRAKAFTIRSCFLFYNFLNYNHL